jgi:hypothetical protein
LHDHFRMNHPLAARFAISVVLLTALVSAVAASDPPRQVFLHPPDEAKPRGYWVWPHVNSKPQ